MWETSNKNVTSMCASIQRFSLFNLKLISQWFSDNRNSLGSGKRASYLSNPLGHETDDAER